MKHYIFRRVLTALLATLLALTCAPAALAEQYTTSWDLTQLYATVDDWYADYNAVQAAFDDYEQYRGRLNDVDTICEFFQKFYMSDLTLRQSRMYLYISLGLSLNPADALFLRLQSLFSVQTAYEYEISAFADEELKSLPYELRKQVFEDERLKACAYAFREYTKQDTSLRGEEALRSEAILKSAMGRAEGIYKTLINVDMPDPVVEAPDGTLVRLTDSAYVDIVYYGDDEEYAARAIEAMAGAYKPYINTLAALLDSCLSENWALARLEGYSDPLEAALELDDVDPSIYNKVLEAAHMGLADYQRYLAIHKYAAGLDVQLPVDIETVTSPYNPGYTAYNDAVETVRGALTPLGGDYWALASDILTSGCVDVYPADNKESGAFCTSLSGVSRPFMMLNYDGSADAVGTLAHELGHAVYYAASARANNAVTADPTIFTQEIASTTNELMVYEYMLANASSDAERLYWLERELSIFSQTFFTQAMYAEFEDFMYKTVESDLALDADTLSQKWEELLTYYRGDSVTLLENSKYGWAGVPHFYYNHYVYQYATSICYAASVCAALQGGDGAYADDYLAFLSAGRTMLPVELLSLTHIDPLDAQTYQRALEFYRQRVDDYARLTGYEQ